ncbi:MAG: DUF1289 domain-containing protein [Gammaproteobacteria bacterium]|nr:DUF1289 domain-containing protein [Gammaproteobacteria bacterium]
MSLASGIESPCVAVCQVDRAAGICRGCRRTLQEIGNWLHFTPEERRIVMADLPHRIRKQARSMRTK